MKAITYVDFIVEKEDRTYRFSVPYNCPFGEAYDVAKEISKQILTLAQKEDEKAEEKDSKNPDII